MGSTSAATSEARVVTLLRAVNLGARNKVPMARLREALEAAGGQAVRTYIQSGNVVWTPPAHSDADEFVEQLVAAEFGVTTTAVSRTHDELRAAAEAYPFEITEPRFAAISFLERTPGEEAIERLLSRDIGDDACAVLGRELHIRYANGTHASKLTPASMARDLGGIEGTARNLRTVQTLVQMSS